MVAGTGLKACCLPAGYQPLCARQGTRLPHHLAHHHWPAIGGSAIYCSALGVATSLFSSKHGLHEHNSFFSSAARGWQMAPCGAGDPFDCGRRARKSRWKSRAGAESTRLVVLVPKITVLRAWDTQGLFARSRPPSHAPPSPSPTLPSPSPPPPSPSPTLPLLLPPASFPSPPPPSPSLQPPSPSRRHLATTIAIGIALAATAYATLSLAVAVAAFAFAFAFAAAAQPAQSASAALAALATVEGRGASLSFDIAPHRDGSIGVRNVVRFLLDILAESAA